MKLSMMVLITSSTPRAVLAARRRCRPRPRRPARRRRAPSRVASHGGHAAEPRAEPGDHHRADQQLALGADVPDAGAERDRHGEAGEEQRAGAHADFRPRVGAAEGPLRQRARARAPGLPPASAISSGAGDQRHRQRRQRRSARRAEAHAARAPRQHERRAARPGTAARAARSAGRGRARAMRCARATISSRSVEISSTAAPRASAASQRRVHRLARRRCRGRASDWRPPARAGRCARARATISFCMLPPDRPRTGASRSPALMA